MPELPEVEFCRRALSRWTQGRTITQVEIADPRVVRDSRTARPSAGSALAAECLRHVARHPIGLDRVGKRILWRFEAGSLLLHLGMTGRWTRGPSAFPKVRLHLDSGDVLTFHDPRLLGGIVPFEDGRAAHAAFTADLGPDALLASLPRLTGKRAVKLVLMDQTVVAGLGNVQAMEALWRAGIHPLRQADSIDAVEHVRLSDAVKRQLLGTLTMLGEGDEVVYVEERGAPNPFPLYQRAGERCPQCAPAGRTSLIQHFRQGGRGTWWCPGCQGEPPRVAADTG